MQIEKNVGLCVFVCVCVILRIVPWKNEILSVCRINYASIGLVAESSRTLRKKCGSSHVPV